MTYIVELAGRKFTVELAGDRVLVDGREYQATLRRYENSPAAVLELEGRSIPLVLEHRGKGAWVVSSFGDRVEVAVGDERIERARRAAAGSVPPRAPQILTAPMPGLVIRVPVTPGQEVGPGSSLVVLEAMKMENDLKAAAPGIVERIEVQAGQAVEKGDVLVRFRESNP